jgi:chromosome condensin MukBEF complex kleisin-like MukF subunit
MFNLLKNLLGGKKKMARTKQYVVYTREFAKGRVSNKVGVFMDEAKNTLDNTGSINGGVIKFKNLKMSRKTPTTELVSKGYDFNVRVIGSGNYEVAKQIKNSVIELLADTGKTVINANA